MKQISNGHLDDLCLLLDNAHFTVELMKSKACQRCVSCLNVQFNVVTNR